MMTVLIGNKLVDTSCPPNIMFSRACCGQMSIICFFCGVGFPPYLPRDTTSSSFLPLSASSKFVHFPATSKEKPAVVIDKAAPPLLLLFRLNAFRLNSTSMYRWFSGIPRVVFAFSACDTNAAAAYRKIPLRLRPLIHIRSLSAVWFFFSETNLHSK